MGIFRTKEKKSKVEPKSDLQLRADRLAGLVQLYFVQRIMQVCAQEDKAYQKQAGVMAMFHGIVLLFWQLDKAAADGQISPGQMVDLKALVVNHFVGVSMDKKKPLQQDLEHFTRWIYDLQQQVGCNTDLDEDACVMALSESLCDLLERDKPQEIARIMARMPKYFAKVLRKKIDRNTVSQCVNV
ncbi:hypothetical protein LJC55_01190 [Eubacteriales bacterium OttesenSCG-928-N14]|nr:hypothetical protein [Eubacteriales bacterium OttesenSCG-928-N14]